jgi:hypothetical protein
MPTRELAAITPKPIIEGMPNVDVQDNFAHASVYSAQSNTSQGQTTSWLSKAQHGSVKALGKWNRGTFMDWGGGDNTTALPQSVRAQPTGM